MANPNLKLATSDPPPRSPERTALAEIIERRDMLAREIEAAQAALRKAHDYRMDAQGCLERAQADAELAMSADAFIEAVRSGDEAEQSKVAAGPSDSIDHLEHDVERWQRTEESCRQRVAEMERDSRYFPIYVQKPIDEIIKAEVDVSTLLDGLDEMWIEVNKRLSILSWLHRNKRIKDEDVPKAFAAIRFQLETDDAAVDVWRKAIKALQNDADTLLPQ
jgi:cell division septum initiation protein DivIVA